MNMNPGRYQRRGRAQTSLTRAASKAAVPSPEAMRPLKQGPQGQARRYAPPGPTAPTKPQTSARMRPQPGGPRGLGIRNPIR